MEKVTIPAQLENLDLMLDVIVRNADKVGFDSKSKFQIKLASEEILVNIIHYAYPEKSGAVEIFIDPKPNERLELVFTDWGIPFDPLSLPEPKICVPLEERKIGGLGVFLVRKIMDELRYQRQGDRNIFAVVKKIKSEKK